MNHISFTRDFTKCAFPSEHSFSSRVDLKFFFGVFEQKKFVKNRKMSAVQCAKKSGQYEKFSPRKLLKLVKAVKPILKLITRKQRTNAVTPSTCNYDIVESYQNDLNESELFQLDFKFFDEPSEIDENMKNEELERKLLEKMETSSIGSDGGRLPWALRSDMDICKRGDEYLTCRQRAEQQVPVATA